MVPQLLFIGPDRAAPGRGSADMVVLSAKDVWLVLTFALGTLILSTLSPLLPSFCKYSLMKKGTVPLKLETHATCPNGFVSKDGSRRQTPGSDTQKQTQHSITLSTSLTVSQLNLQFSGASGVVFTCFSILKIHNLIGKNHEKCLHDWNHVAWHPQLAKAAVFRCLPRYRIQPHHKMADRSEPMFPRARAALRRPSGWTGCLGREALASPRLPENSRRWLRLVSAGAIDVLRLLAYRVPGPSRPGRVVGRFGPSRAIMAAAPQIRMQLGKQINARYVHLKIIMAYNCLAFVQKPVRIHGL